MEDSHAVTRRALFAGAGAAALGSTLALAGADTPASAESGPGGQGSLPKGRSHMRPTYHFSVPDNWKNDPQRPIYLDGEYHYYYLYNADYIDGGGGTAWRRATTRDHVSFRDRGVAIPKFSNA